MNGHFDLAALGMLVAVAETGGFTAASARLGRTQSAISVRSRIWRTSSATSCWSARAAA